MAPQRSQRYCHTCGTRLARDNRLSQCATCQRKAGELALGPPALTKDFWSSGVMAEALHSWHIGQVIRAYRHHPFHGPRPLSQELVAGWLGLTQTQLSRIESGPAVKDLGKLVAWARALRIPTDQLWFKLPDVAPATPPSSSSPPLDSARADESAAQSVLSGFRDFDGSIVDDLAEQLRHCKTDDGAFGPARALPVVLGVIKVATHQMRDAGSVERRRLLTLGADGAEFTGWLYRDLEDTASATYWYDRAMEWAQAANDTALQGYVLLKKSQMAYDQRDAYRVAMFAEAAQHGPWQLPAAIRAEVTQQEVVAMAMLGEPLSAIERKTDEARRLLLQAAEDGSSDVVNAYFNMETLGLRAAACYTEAGKPKRAAELFDEIISRGTLSHRDLGFFSARRATALALSGEPDEAAVVGLASFQVAKETHSERTVHILGEVVRTLEPWSSRPGPRTLKEAVLA